MKKVKLKAEMWKRGLRQRDVAAKAGIPYSYLSSYINGKWILKPCEIEKIANVIGVPVEVITEDQ